MKLVYESRLVFLKYENKELASFTDFQYSFSTERLTIQNKVEVRRLTGSSLDFCWAYAVENK